MIKNKNEVICEKCGKAIEPLGAKSIGKNVVSCSNCPRGRKNEHIWIHIDGCTQKIEEVPEIKYDDVVIFYGGDVNE